MAHTVEGGVLGREGAVVAWWKSADVVGDALPAIGVAVGGGSRDDGKSEAIIIGMALVFFTWLIMQCFVEDTWDLGVEARISSTIKHGGHFLKTHQHIQKVK